MAKLFASNGELLLNSENYASEASAKSAVATITANGIAGNFIIDSDKKGRYFSNFAARRKPLFAWARPTRNSRLARAR